MIALMEEKDSAYNWAKEHLGESVGYPGHPIVLALMIMERYAKLSDATVREPGKDCPNALRDGFIPGSGCAVHAALDVLTHAQRQGLKVGYEFADRYWQNFRAQTPVHEKNFIVGKAQFERIKPLFEERFAVWGSKNDPGSPYRIDRNRLAVTPTEECCRA